MEKRSAFSIPNVFAFIQITQEAVELFEQFWETRFWERGDLGTWETMPEEAAERLRKIMFSNLTPSLLAKDLMRLYGEWELSHNDDQTKFKYLIFFIEQEMLRMGWTKDQVDWIGIKTTDPDW